MVVATVIFLQHQMVLASTVLWSWEITNAIIEKKENFAEADRVAMSFKYDQKVFLSSYCTIGICATAIDIKDTLSSIENLDQISPFISPYIGFSKRAVNLRFEGLLATF